MRNALRLIVMITVVAIATACSSTTRSVDVHDLESSIWATAEEFCYNNEDSLSQREIAIVVRYDRGYVADSVPMRILCITPDSLVAEEHFTLHIPHLDDMRPAEQTFPYRSNVVLGRKGEYTFRLTPQSSIKGIQSVGIAISEPEPKEQ